ncbi:protein of unknown function [Pseudomonas mediterranea]
MQSQDRVFSGMRSQVSAAQPAVIDATNPPERFRVEALAFADGDENKPEVAYSQGIRNFLLSTRQHTACRRTGKAFSWSPHRTGRLHSVECARKPGRCSSNNSELA